MIEIPNGISSSVNISSEVCGTSIPAVSQFDRYPTKTSTVIVFLSRRRYSLCGFKIAHNASMCLCSGSDLSTGACTTTCHAAKAQLHYPAFALFDANVWAGRRLPRKSHPCLEWCRRCGERQSARSMFLRRVRLLLGNRAGF